MRYYLRPALGVVLSVVCLLFVWPTPWRVYAACPGYVRVHRLYNRAETLTPSGWAPYVAAPVIPARRGFKDLADSIRAIEADAERTRHRTGIPDRP